MRNYVVMAVEYPLYELITHDLLQALPILKRPGIPEASFHCLATDWTAKAGGAANDRSTAARRVGDLRIMGTGSLPAKAAGFEKVGQVLS